MTTTEKTNSQVTVEYVMFERNRVMQVVTYNERVSTKCTVWGLNEDPYIKLDGVRYYLRPEEAEAAKKAREVGPYVPVPVEVAVRF